MPTTQQLSNVSCKLNKKFKAAIASKRFYKGEKIIDSIWGSKRVPMILDKQNPKRNGPRPGVPGMNCCGLEELNFYPLQDYFRTYIDNKKVFLEWVSCFIRESIHEKDKRLLIVGIPTKVGTSSSYNIEFYTQLRETLKEIGFVEAAKPYKNQNSQNTIVPMIGQLP